MSIRTLTGVIFGVVWLLVFASPGVPLAEAGKSEKFLQDFSSAFKLLHEMGLPEAPAATYGKLANPQDYSGRGELFYDLEMKGGQWRLPGDRVMTISGSVSEIPKLPGVEWHAVDLAADVATLLKYLEQAETEGYGNLSHQVDSLAKLIFFSAQLADQGLKDDANRLVAHALAASGNPRDPIRQALQSLAGSAYGEILGKHLTTSDWQALAGELVSLRERFGSSWDGGPAVDLLIERLNQQEASGSAIQLPEGIELSEEDSALVRELVESTAKSFEQLAKPVEPGGDGAEVSEQERMMAAMQRQPGQLMQVIQSLFTSSAWWSSDAAVEGEGDDSDDDRYAEAVAMAAGGGGAMAIDSMPGMEKWQELAERKFDALPVLLALAADERFLPASATALRNGGYDNGMDMQFSSHGNDVTAEQQYAQMSRPVQMSELAELLLQGMLPGINVEVLAGGGGEPDEQRAELINRSAELYLRLKDQPEIEITREMFASGGGRQALALLCRQGNEQDFADIEDRLLGGGSSSPVDPFMGGRGQSNYDYDSIYLYLKTRGDAGEAFYQKVSENAKEQLAALGEEDWQRDQLKRSMQRIDALYSTETAKDILARVLDDDAEEGLMESIALILETLSQESPDDALTVVLEAMVAHEKDETRIELLQLLSQFSQMEFPDQAGQLSAPEKFAEQWLVLLEDDREVGADKTNVSKTSAWMFLSIHGSEAQIATAGELWQSLGEGSMDYLRERAVAICKGEKPPDFPDASTVDAARVGELEGKLLAATGPALQKVWAEMSFSETLAIRERLKSADEPPQPLIDHLAAQVWQVLEVKLPETVTKLLTDGDSPSVAAWTELKALEGSELNYEKLVALFTKLMPIAAHQKEPVSWQISMSGDGGSSGVSVEVMALDTDELAEVSESDQMLNYLTNRALENSAAILTVSGEELGGGIWLGAMADADSGKIPETPESELGGDMLPASYFDNSRAQWLKRVEALFRPDMTGDPNFEFSLKIVLTSSDIIAAVASEEE